VPVRSGSGPQVAGHDHGRQLLAGQPSGQALADLYAVFQNGDPLCHGQDVLHVVADHQDRHALIMELPYEIKDLGRLFDPKGCGGFVHDDKSSIPPQGTADGHSLALAGISMALMLARSLRFALSSTIIVKNVATGPVSHHNHIMKFKKSIVPVSVAWIILITMSFLWNYSNAAKERETIAFETARSFFNLIVITRDWNSRHGGVYVPMTEKTLPNPYLDDSKRDIEVDDSLKLTKVNPAFMTRQLSEIAEERSGIIFHITSLKPIRPENKPTLREVGFLREFEGGTKERGLFVKEDSKTLFFYMAPLQTEQACLNCHSKQGYKEGDIRGGISVTLPFGMGIPLSSLLLGHVGIGLIGLVGIFVAGVRLSKAYETIERQAVMDALTEIPNRQSFSDTMEREFKRSQREQAPLSIIMCDIDHFKEYNDSYGHSNGDLCLKKVAQAIRNSLKRAGDFCARYGGEEFIVILPNTSPDGAMRVAERMRLNVEEMGIAHMKSLPAQVVTMSFGVATSEDTATLVSLEDLIKCADVALYRAKEQGRNQVQFFRETA